MRNSTKWLIRGLVILVISWLLHKMKHHSSQKNNNLSISNMEEIQDLFENCIFLLEQQKFDTKGEFFDDQKLDQCWKKYEDQLNNNYLTALKRAFALYQLDDFEDAIEQSNIARKSKSKQERLLALRLQSIIYGSKSEDEKKMEVLDEALKEFPLDAQLLCDRGAEKFYLNDVNGALKDFKLALSKGRHSMSRTTWDRLRYNKSVVEYLVGSSLTGLKKYKEALVFLNRSIKTYPKSVTDLNYVYNPFNIIIFTHMQLGNYDEVIQISKRALKRPVPSTTYNNIAAAYYQKVKLFVDRGLTYLEDFDTLEEYLKQANSYCDQALKLQPDYHGAQENKQTIMQTLSDVRRQRQGYSKTFAKPDLQGNCPGGFFPVTFKTKGKWFCDGNIWISWDGIENANLCLTEFSIPNDRITSYQKLEKRCFWKPKETIVPKNQNRHNNSVIKNGTSPGHMR